MLVRCLDLEYQEGSFALVQNVKKGTGEIYGESRHFQDRGHGWGQYTTKSEMLLTVESDELEERIVNIGLGDFFKAKWGKLSQQRQVAIINTMPDFIEVSKESYEFGEAYYQVDHQHLLDWLARAQKEQKRAQENRARMAKEIAARQKLQ